MNPCDYCAECFFYLMFCSVVPPIEFILEWWQDGKIVVLSSINVAYTLIIDNLTIITPSVIISFQVIS